MKIIIQIRGTVTYNAELTMTKGQYRQWCDRIDAAKGMEINNAAHDLLEKARLDLADPSDWGDLEVETFEPTRS